MASSSGRSPRRVNFEHPALAAYEFSTTKPAEDSLSWKLWLDCQDLAQEALASDYIQGLRSGHLDPRRFGQYTVQDAAYCYHAQADYERIEERALAAGFPELGAFAKARVESYQSYNQSFLKEWHISSGEAVVPSSAAKTYIDFEHHVACDLPPIYGVLVMVPCDQLWSWLATELQPEATKDNIYGFWAKDNEDWHGSYRLDNFIDRWFKEHPEVYDQETALYVLRSGMTCEVNFFRTTCGQDPLPMPAKPAAGS